MLLIFQEKATFCPFQLLGRPQGSSALFLLTQFFCKFTRWPPTNTRSQAASHYATPYTGLAQETSVLQLGQRFCSALSTCSLHAVPVLRLRSGICQVEPRRLQTELLAAAQAQLLGLYAKSDGAFGSEEP